MKSLGIIFNYIKKYPRMVTGYFILNILSAFFSLISLAMLAPFLTLIFGLQQDGTVTASRFKLGGLTDRLYDTLSNLTQTPEGRIQALAIICMIVIFAIVLKNIFLYYKRIFHIFSVWKSEIFYSFVFPY